MSIFIREVHTPSPVAFAAVPALEELKQGRQWVCYTAEKTPIDASTGKAASCDNPNTWASYEDTLQACLKYIHAVGVGRQFLAEDGLVGFDLDKCVDAQGQLSDFAQAIVTQLNSYTEYSPSGRGIHIWARGNILDNIGPDVKADGDTKIEMYDHDRYFTVTGDHVQGTPTTIKNRQREINSLYKETQQRRQKAKQQEQRQATPTLAQAPKPSSTGDTPYGLKALEAECAILRTTAEGGRDVQMNKSAFAMGQLVGGHELSYATAEAAVYEAAQATDLPEKQLRKIPRIIEQGMQEPRSAPITEKLRSSLIRSSGIQTPVTGSGQDSEQPGQVQAPTLQPPFRCTDLGNAERFALRYEHKARWCGAWNCWMIFNGKCWEKDRIGRVDQFAKVVVRAIYREAADEPDDAKRQELAKHARSSESNRSIRAMLERAKSELPATPEMFNKPLDLLNCENGTLNLRTGELKPHDASDMLTRCLKIKYNPLATCPQWDTFVSTILGEDKALIQFVKEALGMSLSGNIKEQAWFLCHGEGNNGKTTMTETVRALLGDYGLAANIKTFQAQKHEGPTYDVAEFYGARMITASENQVGTRLNEAFIKKITGNEPLRAARKFENEFQFMPECTIWLSVNHKPIVKDTSKGMWRRVRYIPFNVTIPDSQVDKELPTKLLTEAEGILAWLVAGCLAWYRNGRLTVPAAVSKATQAYQDEQDTIARFFKEECIFGTGRTSTHDLNTRYELWCQNKTEKPDTRALKDELNKRNLHSKRGTGGKWVYAGIELKPMNSDGSSDGSDGTEEIQKTASTGSTSHFIPYTDKYYTLDSDGSDMKIPIKDVQENKLKNFGESDVTTVTTVTTTVTNQEETTKNGKHDGARTETNQFIADFCSQHDCSLRLREDGNIGISVPKSMSDAEFDSLAALVLSQESQLKVALGT